VGFIKLNEKADLGRIIEGIKNLTTEKDSSLNAYNERQGCVSIKGNIFEYIISTRETYDILDIAKVADVLVFVFSCGSVDVSNWKKDPDVFANAIDERGYEVLSLIRS